MKAYERLLKYVQYPTGSDESSETCPSTKEQLVLGAALCDEMRELGISNVEMDENGYVYGEIPASEGCVKAPVIGFVAHMDVVDEVPFTDIKPKIVDYKGGDVVLNEELGIVLSPKDFPSLLRNTGKHLIVTDGTTLLGADDKAGVAEILSAAELLLASNLPHGTVKIAFTPDEEIGEGADHFDVAGFGAEYAYTVDGGAIGELEYENFNAASALVEIAGLSIHPGSACGKMVNASLVAMEFASLLPALETPYFTDGYEGFFHLTDMTGTMTDATLRYIIRDHDREKFEAKKALFAACVERINARYGEGTAAAAITDSYYNMKEKILPHFHLIERAESAFRANGVEPACVPIRGGTDGARLSWDGLPCPNLSTGGYNFHGVREWIPAESLGAMTRVLVTLVQSCAE